MTLTLVVPNLPGTARLFDDGTSIREPWGPIDIVPARWREPIAGTTGNHSRRVVGLVSPPFKGEPPTRTDPMTGASGLVLVLVLAGYLALIVGVIIEWRHEQDTADYETTSKRQILRELQRQKDE